MKFLGLLALVLVIGLPDSAAAADRPRRASPALASLPQPAAAHGPLRILLVDDDISDNNHNPRDTRLSQSDRVFRNLVSDAVGGDASAWAIETVRPNANGPDFERLRQYSLIVWYTGGSYGGNPDNAAVLSIQDEKSVRRYLEQTGGAVILISPGYVSKVLGAGSTWEESSWPFLSEVLGIRGGQGLVQRFLPGTVNASGGAEFNVGKGGAVESQFSTVNPDGAAVVFTTLPSAAKQAGTPTPVATAFPYGRGRMVYVGFTFENLAEKELAPAFQHLLAATGLSPVTMSASSRRTDRPKPPVNSPEAEPATVQVSGTPTSAAVSWTLQTVTVRNATLGGAPQQAASRTQPAAPAPEQTPTVKVERLVPNAAPVRLNAASPEALQASDPGPLTPGQAVTYRVTLTDARGRTGVKEASFTPPAPRDPASVSASVQPDGAVILTWPEVPGVTSYQVSADDRAIAPVIVRRATEWRSTPLDKRIRRWTVNSVYEPGGSLTTPASWPSAQSRFVPVPGAAFLSKPSGAGGPVEAAAHYGRQCGSPSLQDCSADGVLLSSSEWQKGTWGEFQFGPVAPGSRDFGLAAERTYLTPRFYSVAFADLNDLGRGRRVGCATGFGTMTTPATVVCWATSHGPVLAAGATANGPALAQAAEQYVNRNDITLSTIVITSRGALFGAWAPPPAPWLGNVVSRGPRISSRSQQWQEGWWGETKNDTDPAWLRSRNWDVANLAPWQREAIVAAVARPALTTALDSQGPKSVPHACTSCHGGRFDASTGMVQGASLLPLIPADLTFSSPAVRGSSSVSWPEGFQNSEEAMRGINELVFRSNPSPTIKERIRTLYGGTATSPTGGIGSRANDLSVPPGWSAQPGLYQKVIAPYCGSCHFAQGGSLSFGSYADVVQAKQAIQRAVCANFTMPHSERLFQKFWKEGGTVSLPGLLSTALGFQSCPQ